MMQPFRIVSGKALHVSREQVRAFLAASYAVLGFHNLHPRKTVTVRFKKDCGRTMVGTVATGGYHRKKNEIELLESISGPDDMLTTCLHEAIHSVIWFPAYTLEKCTSTLTARLKDDVAKLAQILLDNTYKRAAFLAHTRLSYRARRGDHYDDAQYREVGVREKYKRAKRGLQCQGIEG